MEGTSVCHQVQPPAHSRAISEFRLGFCLTLSSQTLKTSKDRDYAVSSQPVSLLGRPRGEKVVPQMQSKKPLLFQPFQVASHRALLWRAWLHPLDKLPTGTGGLLLGAPRARLKQALSFSRSPWGRLLLIWSNESWAEGDNHCLYWLAVLLVKPKLLGTFADTWHLSLLNFTRSLLAHSSSLSRSLGVGSYPGAFQVVSPVWCHLHAWWLCALLPLPGQVLNDKSINKDGSQYRPLQSSPSREL